MQTSTLFPKSGGGTVSTDDMDLARVRSATDFAAASETTTTVPLTADDGTAVITVPFAIAKAMVILQIEGPAVSAA